MKSAMTFAAVVVSGCTDAERSDLASLTKPHIVTCFSGGQQVYRATSTGMVMVGDGGEYHFKDADTNLNTTVNVDCVITVLQSEVAR